MHRLLWVALSAISLGIHANDTWRIDQQVLTSGDPVTHVIDWALRFTRNPCKKESLQNQYGA
jgi:hypothetical protein